MKTKKALAITSALALMMALGLAGCHTSGSANEATPGESEITATDTSAPAEQTQTATWTAADSASAAAQGAGLDSFAVPTDGRTLSIGTIDTQNWSFQYTDGIAEGDAGVSAAALVVRKSENTGDNTTPLSTYTQEWSKLDGMTYANQWTQTVEGMEVTCFGNVDGLASKMIWDKDGHGYSVMVLGQGDNWSDFGIGEGDIDTLVSAVMDANTAQVSQDQPSQAQAQPAQTTANDAEDYVNALVWQNGLGELVSYKQTQDANGNWVLEVVTIGADGNQYSSVIDANGNVLENGYVQANGGYTEADGEYAAWENGLGEYVSSQQVVGADGNYYHEITTIGADGNQYVSYIDANGNVVQGGVKVQ